mmetsp:Transcript_105069/g.263164  ORF Transcript_105069/g.263164 Transcript_105069/m.263164 type:complete len:211 (-) Transcript_105069:599-1231(-)
MLGSYISYAPPCFGVASRDPPPSASSRPSSTAPIGAAPPTSTAPPPPPASEPRTPQGVPRHLGASLPMPPPPMPRPAATGWSRAEFGWVMGMAPGPPLLLGPSTSQRLACSSFSMWRISDCTIEYFRTSEDDGRFFSSLCSRSPQSRASSDEYRDGNAGMGPRVILATKAFKFAASKGTLKAAISKRMHPMAHTSLLQLYGRSWQISGLK